MIAQQCNEMTETARKRAEIIQEQKELEREVAQLGERLVNIIII